MSSQKDLIDLFKAGQIEGENSVPKHIETVISNVFLFKERVYKLYKNNNANFNSTFNDLSKQNIRFEFAEKDFLWNKKLSPGIYIDIVGVSIENKHIILTDIKNAEDIVQISKVMPSRAILFDQLVNGELTSADAYSIGVQFAHLEKNFSWNKIGFRSIEEVMDVKISDMGEWVGMASDCVQKNMTNKYITFLKSLGRILIKKYTLTSAIAFDIHTMNAFYYNGVLYPFDTFPPKLEWLEQFEFINIYRIATDMYALGNKELFENLLKGYASVSGKDFILTEEVQTFGILYSALIATPLLCMMSNNDESKKEIAQQYRSFLQNITFDESLLLD